MSEYLSEKEQIEQLKGWWRENGRFVLTGLVLGAALVGGGGAWKRYKLTHETLASETYNSLFTATQTGDVELAARLAEELRSEYARTPYADQAGLALAKAYVGAGRIEDAAAELAHVIEGTDDDLLKHVARLRLASLKLSLGLHDDALAVLDVAEPGAFAAAYHELRGDAQQAKGERDAAREAYRLALAADTEGVIDRQVVQMKLDDLADASAEDGAPDETVAAEVVE